MRPKQATQYEFSNLPITIGMGKVLTTVTDKKIPVDVGNNDTIDWYVADITSATDSAKCYFETYTYKVQNLHWLMPISKSLKFDKSELLRIHNRYYYPFGSPMDGRTFSGDTYRFGFNGQEKDDEVAGAGNINTAMDWEYDTRLGRRWNVDPEFFNFPSQSPYACFNNNSILFADPTGRSGELSIVGNTIVGNTIVVTSVLVFYGSQANTKIAQASAIEIQNLYNAANAKVIFNGKEYNVQFKIYFQIKTEEEAYEMAANNESAKYNFIRVKDTKDAEDPLFKNRSEMSENANYGYFVTTDELGVSTTVAHEYGHGLGLLHPQEEGNLSLVGEGQPNIMAPRNTSVDAQYRWEPKKKGSTLNPYKRKVLSSDVKKMFKNVSFNSKTGKFEVGKASNRVYTGKNNNTKPAKSVVKKKSKNKS